MMAQYECTVCGFVFDETKENQTFDDLPADWKCPVCGAEKSSFQKQDEPPST
jgi:rubredoxin